MCCIRCPEQTGSSGPLQHRPLRKHRSGSLNCAEEDAVCRPFLCKSPSPFQVSATLFAEAFTVSQTGLPAPSPPHPSRPCLQPRPPEAARESSVRHPPLPKPSPPPWARRADGATSEAFPNSAQVHPPSCSQELGLQLRRRTTRTSPQASRRLVSSHLSPSHSGQTRRRRVTACLSSFL